MNTYAEARPGEAANVRVGGVTVIDYGAGNLASVAKAFQFLGVPTQITCDAEEVLRAERLVLPGVGSFGRAMARLREMGLDEATVRFVRSGRPFLGICLGLQLLMSESEETGGAGSGEASRVRGLGLVRGVVRRLDVAPLKVPHVGWNQIRYSRHPGRSPASGDGHDQARPGPGHLFDGIPAGSHLYFVHSFYADPDDPGVVSAYCDYGPSFPCALGAANVHAVQFHPEKSGPVGLTVLHNFSIMR